MSFLFPHRQKSTSHPASAQAAPLCTRLSRPSQRRPRVQALVEQPRLLWLSLPRRPFTDLPAGWRSRTQKDQHSVIGAPHQSACFQRLRSPPSMRRRWAAAEWRARRRGLLLTRECLTPCKWSRAVQQRWRCHRRHHPSRPPPARRRAPRARSRGQRPTRRCRTLVFRRGPSASTPTRPYASSV
jgi:hypothetical protein